MQRNKKGL